MDYLHFLIKINSCRKINNSKHNFKILFWNLKLDRINLLKINHKINKIITT